MRDTVEVDADAVGGKARIVGIDALAAVDDVIAVSVRCCRWRCSCRCRRRASHDRRHRRPSQSRHGCRR